MKKMWKLLVAAILSIGGVAAANTTPASAWLSTCSGGSTDAVTVPGYAWEKCTTYGAPGGYNQVRAIAYCTNSVSSGSYRGNWQTIGSWSYAFCPTNWTMYGHSYELR